MAALSVLLELVLRAEMTASLFSSEAKQVDDEPLPMAGRRRSAAVLPTSSVLRGYDWVVSLAFQTEKSGAPLCRLIASGSRRCLPSYGQHCCHPPTHDIS